MSNRPDLDELFARVRRKIDAMTPDQRAHMDHASRISWAAGNVALSWPEVVDGERAIELATRLVCAKAGPCPCSSCKVTREYRGRVARGPWVELVATGQTVLGEILEAT